MNKKSRYLVFALIAFCISLPQLLSAATPEKFTDRDLEEEQRVIDSYVRDAESDLKYAQSNVGRDMINSAWWYVTESGIKIDQARVLMKTHPQRIERCDVPWYRNAKTQRQKLRDGHAVLKRKIDKANGLLKAVEKDVGLRLGIDVGTFRDTLAILKVLCENGAGSQYCDYFSRLKGLIEAGKTNEAIAFVNEISGEIKQAFVDHKEIIKDLPEGVTPPSSDNTSTTGSTQNASTGGNASTNNNVTTPGNNSSLQGGGQGVAIGTSGGQVSAAEKEKLFAEAREAQKALSQIDDPAAQKYADELDKALAADDYDKVKEIMEKIKNFQVVKDEDGKLIFVLPNEKTIVPAYIGDQNSGQLKLEKIYKLVASQTKNDEYEAKLLETVEWQFVIAPEMVSSAGDSATYSLTLKDLNKNTNFSIDSWHVYNPDGSINTEGSGNPLEVLLKGTGDFRIIVEGATEHDTKGSSFKIETIIRL
jgi:hypothetical protein